MAAHPRYTHRLLLAGSLIAPWRLAGTLPALAAAFGIVAYLFVSRMRMVAEEIKQFERDQRPDLQHCD
jgi:hypothetical protein